MTATPVPTVCLPEPGTLPPPDVDAAPPAALSPAEAARVRQDLVPLLRYLADRRISTQLGLRLTLALRGDLHEWDGHWWVTLARAPSERDVVSTDHHDTPEAAVADFEAWLDGLEVAS